MWANVGSLVFDLCPAGPFDNLGCGRQGSEVEIDLVLFRQPLGSDYLLICGRLKELSELFLPLEA